MPRWRARSTRALAKPALNGARVGALVVDDARRARPVRSRRRSRARARLEPEDPDRARGAARVRPRARIPDARVRGRAARRGGQRRDALRARRRRPGPHVGGLLAARRRPAARRAPPRARGLAIDDSLFDGERWHPSWLPTSARAYHAPIGALMANYGAFAVVVEGGARDGDPARVAVDPAIGFFRVANQARTGPRPRPRRRPPRRRAAARRCVAADRRRAAWSARSSAACSIPPATRRACSRLQLAAVGIAVGARSRRASCPTSAHELLAFEGAPALRRRAALPQVQQQPDRRGADQVARRRGDGCAGELAERRRRGARELDALGLPTRGPRAGGRLGALVRRPRLAAPAGGGAARGLALVRLRRRSSSRACRSAAPTARSSSAREARGPRCAPRPACSRA